MHFEKIRRRATRGEISFLFLSHLLGTTTKSGFILEDWYGLRTEARILYTVEKKALFVV